MLITSNRAVGEWGSVFGDAVVATAILDRLLHHSHVLIIRGDSYRLLQPHQHDERGSSSERRKGSSSGWRLKSRERRQRSSPTLPTIEADRNLNFREGFGLSTRRASGSPLNEEALRAALDGEGDMKDESAPAGRWRMVRRAGSYSLPSRDRGEA